MDSPDIMSALYWLSWLDPLKTIAEAGVVIALAVGLIATVIGNPLTKKVEKARELQLKRLTVEATMAKAEIATATADAAKANERAALAAEALAKYRARWFLTPDGEKGILEALEQFPGIPFEMAVEFDGDSVWMMQQIVHCLIKAKWIPRPFPAGTISIPGMPVIGAVAERGNRIVAPSRYLEAAKALSHALHEKAGVGNVFFVPGDDAGIKSVQIIIGKRE